MSVAAPVPVSNGSGARGAESAPMAASAPSPAPPPGRYGQRGSARRSALALAIALHLLVALGLAWQKREPIIKMAQPGLKTFSVTPPAPSEAEAETQKSETPRKQQAETAQAQQVTPAAPEPPPLPPPVVKQDLQMPFIVLSRQDYAASNIGKQPSLRPALAAAGPDSKAPAGPGAGPGGATLYPADWFRPPTDTELGGYLKPGQPRRGWGMIACKTVARHRVEDCYVLGESPMGSGFGRSVLNAAWQFEVLPPRINGRAQIGSWVSIRIDYTPSGGARAQ